jgi:hypothetical protein
MSSQGKPKAFGLHLTSTPSNDMGERGHVHYDDDWGYFPELDEDGQVQINGGQTEEDQVSVAKIADSLDDLKADYELHFEHKLKHEPEFVRVVKWGEGHLLRQLIDREGV